MLKEKLGKKRILLSDDQRRRLAAKGKVLGRKALQEIATIATPDTILRWHRELVATDGFLLREKYLLMKAAAHGFPTQALDDGAKPAAEHPRGAV